MLPHLRTIGVAVGIVSISQFLAKLQVLPVYAGFLAAILNFVMISMTLSRIIVDCTIVLSSLENIGFAVGIASISQLLANFKYFRFMAVDGRHLEFLTDIDVGH